MGRIAYSIGLRITLLYYSIVYSFSCFYSAYSTDLLIYSIATVKQCVKHSVKLSVFHGG